MDIPVYLITGFLEAGKTQFMQDVLTEQALVENGTILLLVCEEGIEEYDTSKFKCPNVQVEIIEEKEELTHELLSLLQHKHNPNLIVIEHNGMWQLEELFTKIPDDWAIIQEIFVCNSKTIENYNKNIRSLVVDKLTTCDLVVFNRVEDTTDRMPLHKLVRGISRNTPILYELTDGKVEPDEIPDPLPFDINADIITIEDKDYAYWYRDLSEEMDKYQGKKVRFKGIVLKDKLVPKGSFICGRHIMTCCADDIQYSAVACKWKGSETLKNESWVTVTGTISIEKHKVYNTPGPVIKVTSVIPESQPEQPLATFD